ncbi:uncharacterized protein N7479_002914 [Penicillium vulpinum]|uniref:Uncharacterized protein n=1 Tax=Penicillium vulpinum TaxID=29845 RepID=A0A1V6RT78_9EURO|nr:uncharacterized protein N7479_002914 [Penicillium vulpinum]KAJ5972996.1 hypothetical protein N7479_002914 [Penicillium vulpinum]OQE04750.1 hypothetical protein PENVUL_c030G00740 [Penicillium vulpinum]
MPFLNSPHESVANEATATAASESAIPDSSTRTGAQRDALAGLDEVIRKMILERSVVQTDIIQQRAVLNRQVAHLSSIDENIQNLQGVWANMATDFSLTSNK